MPTYNYRCESCNNEFVTKQSIKDQPLSDCNICNGRIKRVISGNTGLIFKGSGFYVTDYAKNSSNNKITKEKTKTSQPKENK